MISSTHTAKLGVPAAGAVEVTRSGRGIDRHAEELILIPDANAVSLASASVEDVSTIHDDPEPSQLQRCCHRNHGGGASTTMVVNTSCCLRVLGHHRQLRWRRRRPLLIMISISIIIPGLRP
jgi:hypothetical protein